jgi:UDP-N-acetylmuramate dehydrogenase
MEVMTSVLPLDVLRAAFGKRLRLNQPLARYTSARIGGSADALIDIASADELAAAAQTLWDMDLPFLVLGGGSNMLVSDMGVREVVLFNQASAVRFQDAANGPVVWAESGAGLGAIARQGATKGLGGLEWAAGIPGTIGGAVFGNAGAHGGDVSMVLGMATILHRNEGRKDWTSQDLAYEYRGSWLKKHPGQAVILSAQFALAKKPQAEIKAQMDTFLAYRRLTQPLGASMGSMFKNPPGESAGRLIEAAGLKGKKIGNAQISPLHANFFLNLGNARAADVYALIQEARAAVRQHHGIELDLEIQLVGEWPAN